MLNNQLTQQQPQSKSPLLTLRLRRPRFTLANQKLYFLSKALHIRKVDIATDRNKTKASINVSLPLDLTSFLILFLTSKS